MRLQRRTPQRLTIFFLVGAIVYFWGAWTLHNLFTLKQGDPSVRVSPPIELAVPLTSDPIVVPKATTAPVIRNKSAKAPPRPDGTFAACLLVMDDNHFLTEWLAYHYHTLPLRHLIIAVDPRSKTSPTPILDRWKKHGMDIIQWNDDDFMPLEERREAERHVKRFFGPNITEDLIQHRARQRLFYFKCMRKHKRRGRDWTLLIDSDEFLYVNYPTVAALNLTAPSLEEPGSVMTFLQTELVRSGNNLTTPCVQIPRIRFGSQESSSLQVDAQVPAGFNANSFQTFRWRQHANAANYLANRISKTMIDLNRVKWEDLVPVSSIHRPIRSICGRRRLHIRKPDQVFVINHYLGSWEQYSFRDDRRNGNERSQEKYKQYDRWAVDTDDEIRPWLDGFVRDKGQADAQALLQGVGELDSIEIS